MGLTICGGATLQCSFGAAPFSLTVLPKNRVSTSMPIANMPALNDSCKLMCAYAGVIQIVSPGQVTIQVP